VRAFVYFCQISANFCSFLHPFFTFLFCLFYPIHPCCQPTFINSPKTNMPAGRTQKNTNFPPFFIISKTPFLNHVNLRNPYHRRFFITVADLSDILSKLPALPVLAGQILICFMEVGYFHALCIIIDFSFCP